MINIVMESCDWLLTIYLSNRFYFCKLNVSGGFDFYRLIINFFEISPLLEMIFKR
ncbi:hypothetical protein SAMN04487987_111105 [Algibacter pectinivorans]|uniref:Uncharacterized protein n=1 Tax=Algibacter pectinivorans TaxID=870482 RepID=A0A1I1RVY8_9FLAO|nr:hypothetical protein SAMN04487987_111105 [Algibacter pectinivorans]